MSKRTNHAPTFVWYFEDVFLQKTGSDFAAETLKKYRRVVSQFVQFCGGPLPMQEVSDELLSGFHTRLVKDGIAEKTAREARSQIVKIMRDWRPEWPIAPEDEQSTAPKPKQGRQLTLLNFFERVYLPEKLKDRKPSYRQKVCGTVTRFTAFCRGDIAIDSITPETLKRYKDWFLETSRGAPATVYRDVIQLRQIAVAAGRVDLRASRMRRIAPQLTHESIDIETFYRETFAKQRSMSPGYEQQMLLTLRNLRRFYKRPPLLEELPAVVNSWVHKMEQTLSPMTIKRRRAAVITIWNYAAECKVCEPPNTKLIRKVKTSKPAPDSWTLDEMKALVEACQIFRGQFYPNGIDRGRFWEAFIRVCYDTALRRGDMLALARRQLEPLDGGFIVRTVQSKTGDGIVHRLRPSTVEALGALFPPDRERVFDYPHNVDTFHDHWKDILAHAGQDPLNRRNGVQKIRRTSASHLERCHPGAATAHLGHRSADMAQKHYLDPKISRGDMPLPPEIA